MAIASYFFNSIANDRPYSAADFAKAFGLITKTGVIPKDDTGAFGLDIGGTSYTTLYAGKATVEGHFVEVTGTELLIVPAGSYSGMVVIKVDRTNARKTTAEVITDQTPTQDAAVFEMPLYNCTVLNGIITGITDLRVQGGAIAKPAANVVTWNADPNGIWINCGVSPSGKIIKLFLTSGQPAAGGTTERRVWLQTDA